MLKIENVVLPSADQWADIIRGTRNPKNSWNRMDSYATHVEDPETMETADYEYFIGPNDQKLLEGLAAGGPVHAKYRRMIPVYLDITAPLYWWKEFDTYKLGTVANSCSTMHKIHAKEFTMEDFSHEHLVSGWAGKDKNDNFVILTGPIECLENTVTVLNRVRDSYLLALKTPSDTGLSAKDIWWQMIQLLPSSYNQKRTVMLNYEVLVNIYRWRRDHKLDEWHTFCDWIESLPYAELITGKEKSIENTPVFEPRPATVTYGVIRTKEEIEQDQKARMEELSK